MDSKLETSKHRWQRGFWSLIVTQFQGAFSDCTLKNLVIFIILGMGLPSGKRDALVPIVGALFALPFILFSMTGGYFADRYSKRSVTIGVKIFEICVMLFAFGGLALKNLPIELAGVFLMGVHSAIFGPSKYGLLPEILPEKRLSWGNGIIELGTFGAIVLGTTFGAVLSDLFRGRQGWSGIILIALAIGGLAMSFGISRLPAAAPQKKFRANFLADLFAQIQVMRQDRVLWLAMVGNTYFAFLATLLQFNIILYGKDILRLGDTQNGYLQASIALGIGLGSVAAGYLSGGKIEYGLVPLGSLGLSAFSLLLGVPGISFGQFAACLAALGFFGGFFIVPVAALLQHKPEKEKKGGVLAAANLLSFIGVFVASGVYYLLISVAHLSPGTVFLCSAALTLAGTGYVLYLLPDSFLRLVLWMVTHSLYRIRVLGRDNIPERGGALFVCNHLSMVDAMFLLASTDRFVRFIMFKDNYEKPLIKPLARILGVIPISSHQRPRDLIKSLQDSTDAIKRGEVVCIFAEGEVTRTGQMLPFQRGFERIMKDVEAPIIPVALDGVWGSIFSFADGRYYWKFPRRIPYPVTVCFGAPMPARSTPNEVRQAVQELHSDAWIERKKEMFSLQRSFIQTARRHPFRFAMADSDGKQINFYNALARTLFLTRRLAPKWRLHDIGSERQMVGILLPPSTAGALVNFAALLAGKIPVNLNYTSSQESLNACIKQANLKSVLTSQAFLDRLKLNLPSQVLLLEEIAARPTAIEKLRAAVLTLLAPARWLNRFSSENGEAEVDQLATIIFSSGSTGEPKGVMLTHYNINSNIQQLAQVFGLHKDDRVLGILPFFHSFGFTATLMLPAALGVGVVYHPNPLDAKTIGPLVRERKVSFLLATPTFLQFYLRACVAQDFGGLRLVMAAAEKLPERVAAAFEEKFGIRPIEGYGCTECSPAATVNTHDFRAAGYRQVGTKRGKIGHPLPGMSVRIVSPETGALLPIGEAGLLLLHGPNVMRGYLGNPQKTAEVVRDGWYNTGDIAALDEDGFLEIRDRLSRFSKIGGEMVPHIKIEEKLHEIAGVTEQTFAVTGVPDESKGERLVVLHTAIESKLKDIQEKLGTAGLPNLWVPRVNQFYRVEKIPVLGTGKMDLRNIREQALKLSAAPLS
jgi:acyl-[acyl-carrier-protein]-phospholipid O-acyltransferase/long-chain-fatty-acid--[acyl-carrier-protein] ligase